MTSKKGKIVYSGKVVKENFFPLKNGKGFLKAGQTFKSESEQAIDNYKQLNYLK